MSSSTQPKVLNPENHPTFGPSYSHVCVAPILATSKLITIAGQIGYDVATQTSPSSFVEQVELALANLQKCLDAAGAKKTDIVRVTHYVVNILDHDYAARSALYMKFMEGHAPPSTLLGVQALATKDLLYEIEAMAIVHE